MMYEVCLDDVRTDEIYGRIKPNMALIIRARWEYGRKDAKMLTIIVQGRHHM
jgi:hypothetical protein